MGKYFNRMGVLVVVFLTLLLVVPVNAQTGAAIEAGDQLVLGGTVTVARAVADGPGFVVIYADNGQGAAGDVIGFAPINAGENLNVQVPIDLNKATPTLHAMLHTDDNAIGTFEFGKVQAADAPVMANGNPVEAAFPISLITAPDQIVDNQVTVARVITQQPAWVVIHSGDANGFGEAIGQTFVNSGVSTNVKVDIDSTKHTDILWPMIHTDTGAANTFEFGTIDQTDLPLIVADKVATLPILTVPSIRMDNNQFVLGNNGIVAGNTAPVVVESVLSDKPAFLAIHNDNNGAIGDVIGFTNVPAGLSTNVKVNIDPAKVTPTLWTVLHTDTNANSTFEFGQVQGADAAAVGTNGQPIAVSVPVAPFLQFQQQQTLNNDQITISKALVKDSAFVVVQADNGNGKPGAVLGQVALNPGLNQNIAAALDPNHLTKSLFLSLNADTNQIGVFEPNGADTTLLLNNRPVMGELTLTGNLPASVSNTTTLMTFPCTLKLDTSTQVNQRSGPGTTFNIVTTLMGGETLTITNQSKDTDGFTWLQTTDGNWIRSDVAGSQCQPASP